VLPAEWHPEIAGSGMRQACTSLKLEIDMHYLHGTWMYDQKERTQFFVRIVVGLRPVSRDGIGRVKIFLCRRACVEHRISAR
jgi:hypothetical protein